MNILLLYGADYQLHWGRSQNFANALAKLGHQIIYINHIKAMTTSNLFNFLKKPVEITDNVFLYSDIPGLPHFRFPFLKIFSALMQPLYLWRILLKKKKFDLVIVYGVPPIPKVFQKFFLRYINTSCIIYDCADDKVSSSRDFFSESASKIAGIRETELVRNVDGVTAINLQNINRLNIPPEKPWQIVPNGIDLNLFTLPESKSPRKLPFKLVYIGAINDRLNIDKIKQLLHKNRDRLELHFYGKFHEVINEFKDIENFNFHGYIEYKKLPEILHKYDFGFIPYRDIESIRMSSPLKLLQYFACGLPVLSFYFKNIYTFDGRVVVIDTDLPDDLMDLEIGDLSFLSQYNWETCIRKLIDFCEYIKKHSGLPLDAK